jgi:UDP-glucuronate decarboxylase
MPDLHILLTGGTGFFGRALLRFWNELQRQKKDSFRVTLLTRSPEAFLIQYPEFSDIAWVEYHTGDILRPTSLPDDRSFTHLLHAAADSVNAVALSPLERFDQIVDGTRRMLDFAVQQKIPRFLLTSTGGVYGVQPADQRTISETCCTLPDPLDPANAYSVAKRAAEHLCMLYQHQYGLETTMARCFAFVGIDLPLNVHFAIGNFIRDALWRDSIEVGGDGTALRSYLDQRDLARWLWTLLLEAPPGSVYNVGSDEAISIAQLAMLVGETLAPGKPVHIRGKADSASPRQRYVPDISRIRAELGVEVTVPLVEAIRHAGAFHRGAESG